MNPRSAIQKGKLLENHIADRIVAIGIDPKARRDSGSGNGNREKGDVVTSMTVLGRNVGIEAKNHATIHIPEWWRQVEKLEVLGREPVLAFKLPGEALEGTKVVIYLETFLELAKRANLANGEVEISGRMDMPDERALKWALEDVKRSVAKATKLVDEVMHRCG